jgi:hypothetical protein
VKHKKLLPLNLVQKFVPLMEKLGVSEIARSPRGFLGNYVRLYGRTAQMSEGWMEKRKGFIARHMTQLIANDEALYKDGLPTRRHLALVAWAYSPDPTGLQKTIRNLP